MARERYRSTDPVQRATDQLADARAEHRRVQVPRTQRVRGTAAVIITIAASVLLGVLVDNRWFIATYLFGIFGMCVVIAVWATYSARHGNAIAQAAIEVTDAERRLRDVTAAHNNDALSEAERIIRDFSAEEARRHGEK